VRLKYKIMQRSLISSCKTPQINLIDRFRCLNRPAQLLLDNGFGVEKITALCGQGVIPQQ